MTRPAWSFALVCLASQALVLSSGAEQTSQSAGTPWVPSPQLVREQGKLTAHNETSIEASHIYTLPELIDLAEKHNPEARAAWNLAKVRAAQLNVAQSELLPTLTAVATAGTSRQGVLFNSAFVRQTIGYYEPVLQVNYMLLDFGGRGARIEAARDQLAAADFAFNAIVLQVLFETERRYYALLNAAGQRDAAQVNLQNATTVSQAVSARLAVGLATLPDALEARSAAARADYELQAAVGQVDIAQGDLLSLLGASPLDPFKVQPLDQLHMPETLDVDVQTAEERSLTQRPELGQHVEEKNAADAAVKQYRSAFLPTLNLNGYGGEIRAWGQQDQLPATYAGPVEVWDTRLELRWDLFEGGRRRAELEEAHAQQRRAQAEIDQTKDLVEQQVWTAYVSLRTAFHERDAAAALLTAARTSYEAALRSYQLGVRNTVDVVTAQRTLAEALSSDVRARTDVLTQLANFSYRTGDLLRQPAPGRNP